MCRLAGERVQLILAEESPTFSNWDQDEQAAINDYMNADTAVIAEDLARQLERAARAFDHVPDGSWNRAGVRGDGKEFTGETFAHFTVYEIEHHLQDAQQGLAR